MILALEKKYLLTCFDDIREFSFSTLWTSAQNHPSGDEEEKFENIVRRVKFQCRSRVDPRGLIQDPFENI